MGYKSKFKGEEIDAEIGYEIILPKKYADAINEGNSTGELILEMVEELGVGRRVKFVLWNIPIHGTIWERGITAESALRIEYKQTEPYDRDYIVLYSLSITVKSSGDLEVFASKGRWEIVNPTYDEW